jgi:cephalosporin hydroxylase
MPLKDVIPIIQQRKMTNTYYFGIPTLKNPNDYWVYQEIIFEMQPDIIIEIGNYKGGSTLALAHLCDLMNKGKVIGIDINQNKIYSKVRNHPRITLIENDACKAYDDVCSFICEDDHVMIIEDSKHSFENVLNILRTYSALTKTGDYFIVEDSIIHHGLTVPQYKEDGPYEAIEFFINENPSFAIDRTKESFFITWNPKGYLKKIK